MIDAKNKWDKTRMIVIGILDYLSLRIDMGEIKQSDLMGVPLLLTSFIILAKIGSTNEEVLQELDDFCSELKKYVIRCISVEDKKEV